MTSCVTGRKIEGTVSFLIKSHAKGDFMTLELVEPPLRRIGNNCIQTKNNNQGRIKYGIVHSRGQPNPRSLQAG